ncbi:MAG: hypothetical protein JSS72_09330 [Armatimonadetes bacterium]|nr:hypothetical protein [Armatimonadota bacterium]
MERYQEARKAMTVGRVLAGAGLVLLSMVISQACYLAFFPSIFRFFAALLLLLLRFPFGLLIDRLFRSQGLFLLIFIMPTALSLLDASGFIADTAIKLGLYFLMVWMVYVFGKPPKEGETA